MGSGRTLDSSGESEGTGVRVLSCLGEGSTGGGGLGYNMATLHHRAPPEPELTKLRNNPASGMQLAMVMQLVKGRQISALPLFVPGQENARDD